MSAEAVPDDAPEALVERVRTAVGARPVDERLHALAIGAVALAGGIEMRLKTVHLPAAAIGLEAARRAAPHGVHAIHVRAASLASHRVFSGRARGHIQRGSDRLDDKFMCGTNGGYLTEDLFHAPTLTGVTAADRLGAQLRGTPIHCGVARSQAESAATRLTPQLARSRASEGARRPRVSGR